MITGPKDIQKIIEKYSESDTREYEGVMVHCQIIPDFDDVYSPMEQACAEIYREFLACSELAKLKERVLDLEKKEFERSKE